METDVTDGSKLPGAGEGGVGSGEGSGNTEMEMLQNPEFLHSVLSSLPGVNPEEALQNLEEMTKVVEDQKDQKKREGTETTIIIIIIIINNHNNYCIFITEGDIQ